MARLFFILLLALLPAVSHANCRGTDLRKSMSPSELAQLSAKAARVPYAEGNHWVASKGNQRVHIVGTFHSGDKRHNRTVRALTPYVKKADLVVLEIHTQKAQKFFDDMAKHPEFYVLQRPPYIDQLMSPKGWAELKKRSAISPLGDDMLKRLQPFLLEATISSSQCDPFAWQRNWRGLDEKIERLAHRNRVPVLALETPAQSVKRLTAIPLRDQVKMMELQMRSQRGDADIATTMRNAYFEENTPLAFAIHEHFIFRDVKVPRSEVARLLRVQSQYLLDRRNKKWMPILLNRKEKTIVVAVGAGHLSGKNGLLNLYRARGYKLQRIPLKR